MSKVYSFLSFFVTVFSSISLLADTFTWASPVSGDFEDSTKWTLASTSAAPEEGVFPGEGDAVVIPSYDVPYAVTVNQDINVASYTVGSESGAIVTNSFKNGLGINTVSGDLLVAAKGVIYQAKNPKTVTTVDNVLYKLRFKIGGNMSVIGVFSADVSGFHKDQTLRHGHGGYGGNLNSAVLGSVYGSIREPTSPGGGGQSNIGLEGRGGGVIYLDVIGDVVVSGRISADGEITTWDSGSAGGSVFIKCATLSGNGKIYARPASYGNTQGGGGRIAIYQRSATNWDSFTGSMSSSNYKHGNSQYASPGTIYLEHAADTPTEGDLIIDGTTTAYKQPAIIGTTVTDASLPFGRVFVKNAAYLRIDNNATLKVRKAISVDSKGVLTTQTGTAAIELVPLKGGTVEISGPLTAQNFICRQPDCTIAFKNGAKLSIPNKGFINVLGTAEEPIRLLPATEGAKYQISLGNDLSADSLIQCVAISNCNASLNAGTIYDSTDLGGNSNVFFLNVPKPGDKIVWHGAKDTVWANGANWTPSRVPIETDIIEIPTGCAKYPSFSADVSVDTLKIASGAKLTVNSGAALRVYQDFENFGTLTLNNGSALKILGDKNQVVELNNSTYENIGIEKTGGSITFLSGFSATIFNAYATGRASLVFAEGEDVIVDKLNIDGAALDGGRFTKNFVLSSSGNKWNLKVVGVVPVIRGASITNCDASQGLEIKVGELCDDATGNVNVDFSSGAAYCWTGAAGTTDFNTAENWLPQAVPMSGFIQINPRVANCTVLLPKGEQSLNLHSLLVEGIGGVTALFTCREHLNLSSSFVIGTKGTVALDYRDMSKVNINTVTGDFILRNGGILTHSALPASASKISDGIYAICVKILGDMRISSDSKVDAGSRGYPLGKGPAWGNTGASHGSVGGKGNACYGSIFNPTTHGSSGAANDYGTIGGGVVNLFIDGDLYADGPIIASVTMKNKKGSRHDGSGAGGSILIKCATLRGAGEISAYGNPQGNAVAGGGRIAIYQREATDWSEYKGKIINGNTLTNKGDSGPVYLETAADEPYGGVLKIVSSATSGFSSTLRTQFPMSDDAGISYKDLTIEVEGGYLSFDGSGAPPVGEKIYIKDLVCKNSKAYVLCKGRKITVLSREHKNCKGWYSTYASHVVEDGGAVRWVAGTAIIIR